MPDLAPIRTVARVAVIGLAVLLGGAFVRDDLLQGDYQTVVRWGELYNAALVVWGTATVCVCAVTAARDRSVGFGVAAVVALFVVLFVWTLSSFPSGVV